MKERSLIQFFPWCSLVVSVGSSVCKGSGLLPSISVIYHPLWGWNNHRHIQSAGPPHSGAWDATQKLMFPQHGLPKLILHPALFSGLLLLGNRFLHFFGPAVKKILDCKIESHNLVWRPASPVWLPATGSFRWRGFLLRVFLLPLQILREMHFKSGPCW